MIRVGSYYLRKNNLFRVLIEKATHAEIETKSFVIMEQIKAKKQLKKCIAFPTACFNEFQFISHHTSLPILQKGNVYKHYKGNYYEVLEMKAQASKEIFVVYRAVHRYSGITWLPNSKQIWARPLTMWNETVNGETPRFELVQRYQTRVFEDHLFDFEKDL